jgi:hypothetical protein
MIAISRLLVENHMMILQDRLIIDWLLKYRLTLIDVKDRYTRNSI